MPPVAHSATTQAVPPAASLPGSDGAAPATAPLDTGARTPPTGTPQLRTAHHDLLPKALANLAMRDLTLVESLLLLIQRLEEREDDPDVLQILYNVDHLGTRMRRNCENLLVMAGEPISTEHKGTVPLHEVAQAAISEIDQYTRVRTQELPQLHIHDVAADDLSHLLAELMENALANSANGSEVTVRGRYRDDGGLVLEIADDGIGIPSDKLARLNAELRETPTLTDETLRHMGLFVVGLLAHRHGFEVQLQTRPFSGTSGFVYLPAGIVAVSQTSGTPGGSAESMPEPNQRPGATPPPASDQNAPTSEKPADPPPSTDAGAPLHELPKREPGRGAPGLRVVDGAAQPPPEPTATEEAAEPGELPELPRRIPGSEEPGRTAAPARRTPSATADIGSDDEDEFVHVRGQPPAGPSAGGDDPLDSAERVRAEFDGYVSGRREYEEQAESGDTGSAGNTENATGEPGEDPEAGHPAAPGKADPR